jgi:hypothetical protein
MFGLLPCRPTALGGGSWVFHEYLHGWSCWV